MTWDAKHQQRSAFWYGKRLIFVVVVNAVTRNPKHRVFHERIACIAILHTAQYQYADRYIDIYTHIYMGIYIYILRRF